MIGFKEILKLAAVMIITFCAVFICTIFINYMIDLKAVSHLIENKEMQALFDGQMTMSKTITASAGGMLGAVSLIVLIYSVGRFIGENSANMGVMKALGYSEFRCAVGFLKFGLAVLISSAAAYTAAYLCSPLFYDPIADINIKFGFHIETVLIVVAMPTVLLSMVSMLYALMYLRKKPLDLINDTKKVKVNKLTQSLQQKDSKNTFLKDLKKSVLFSNLSLIFFVGFAALAFSTQIQMAMAIRDYASDYTAAITLISMGLILGSVTLLIALTFVINTNKKYIAMLKAFGYTEKECSSAMLSSYRLVAYIGFVIGTAYKYILLSILIDSFAGPDANVSVTFDALGFFVTLAAFIIFYELTVLLFRNRINKISLREIMQS